MIYDILVRLKRAFAPSLAMMVVTLSSVPCAQADQGGIPGKLDSNSPFSAIYVIGDSLSDTGRAATVLPITPYPYYAGRMSNGPVWIEYFAPMVRQGYDPLDNLSWAGAMTGFTQVTSLPPVYNNVYGPLHGMTNQLVELQSLTNSALDPNALYVVFGGTNDFQKIFLPPGEDPSTVIQTAVVNLFTIVNSLHVMGATNVVLVNVADLGRTPYARGLGPQVPALATQYSIAFNQLLDQYVALLRLPVCKINLFDLSRDFTDKPKKYGFTNVNDQSFPDLTKGETYLFWDQLHPTTRAHRFIADEIFQAVAKAGMFKQGPK